MAWAEAVVQVCVMLTSKQFRLCSGYLHKRVYLLNKIIVGIY